AACLPDIIFDEPSQGPEKNEAISMLTERLSSIINAAGGDIGIAVIHVETGHTTAIQGTTQLPLQSVFKLPLAIAVLKEIEENRLQLDRKVRVTPADVAPGWTANAAMWRRPIDRTVAQLIEVSIIRSDNTSSDKLLQLVGGPAAVTHRMRALGFPNIEIVSTEREFSENRTRPNTGSAEDLARLLVQLQKGELLQPQHSALLLGFMHRATTGTERLRGSLPVGTPVADKTGTGDAGVVTNDVGIITLPKGQGHLAIAVLISGSKLSPAAQEKLIAEIARAAYDAHVSRAE
uniref:beta-lactamase n=1 Tax=uncultured soil bacterium TaxID=164851 RepID=UPI0028CBC147|nr:Chain A, beta-lactamase [uncultured soil bacterium]8EO7_B Chain B, beta-lactamase [uncultured soil bacterium]